jgi:hypothetical protein
VSPFRVASFPDPPWLDALLCNISIGGIEERLTIPSFRIAFAMGEEIDWNHFVISWISQIDRSFDDETMFDIPKLCFTALASFFLKLRVEDTVLKVAKKSRPGGIWAVKFSFNRFALWIEGNKELP